MVVTTIANTFTGGSGAERGLITPPGNDYAAFMVGKGRHPIRLWRALLHVTDSYLK
jgi:hypothetical protein